MSDNPSFIPAGAAEFSYRRYFDTNTITGAVVELQQKTNEKTGAVSYVSMAGTPYVAVGTLAEAPIRVVLSAVSGGTSDFLGAETVLAPPANCSNATIHVYDPDGIVYTLSGTAPTATVGIRQNNGATFELESLDEITAFKCFSLGLGIANGLYVEFTNVSDDQNQSRA